MNYRNDADLPWRRNGLFLVHKPVEESMIFYFDPFDPPGEDIRILIMKKGGHITDDPTSDPYTITLASADSNEEQHNHDQEILAMRNEHDRFHCLFIKECIKEKGLVDLNKYRIGESIFQDYDVMEVLLRRRMWNIIGKKNMPLASIQANEINNYYNNFKTTDNCNTDSDASVQTVSTSRKRNNRSVISTSEDDGVSAWKESKRKETPLASPITVTTKDYVPLTPTKITEPLSTSTPNKRNRVDINASNDSRENVQLKRHTVSRDENPIEAGPPSDDDYANKWRSVECTKKLVYNCNTADTDSSVSRKRNKRIVTSTSSEVSEEDAPSRKKTKRKETPLVAPIAVTTEDDVPSKSTKTIEPLSTSTHKKQNRAHPKASNDTLERVKANTDTATRDGSAETFGEVLPVPVAIASNKDVASSNKSTTASTRTPNNRNRVANASTSSNTPEPVRRQGPEPTNYLEQDNSRSTRQTSPFSSSDVESLASTSDSSNTKPFRSFRPYTNHEKKELLNFVCRRNYYRYTRGNKIWMKAETLKILPNRTHQSMKEHFRKQILPGVKNNKSLSNEEKAKFVAAEAFIAKNRRVEAPI